MTDLTKYAEIQTYLDVGATNPHNVQGDIGDGFAGTDFQGIADAIMLKDKTQPKASVQGSEVWGLIDYSEFSNLTDVEKNQVLALCSITDLDPYGPGADLIQDIFGGGAGPNTIAALAAYRDESVSTADINGWGTVSTGDILSALYYGNN